MASARTPCLHSRARSCKMLSATRISARYASQIWLGRGPRSSMRGHKGGFGVRLEAFHQDRALRPYDFRRRVVSIGGLRVQFDIVDCPRIKFQVYDAHLLLPQVGHVAGEGSGHGAAPSPQPLARYLLVASRRSHQFWFDGASLLTMPFRYSKLAATLSAGGMVVSPNFTSCSTTAQPE